MGVGSGFQRLLNDMLSANPATRIDHSIPKDSIATLQVYYLLEKHVATLFSGNLMAGTYEAPFDGSHFASGVHFDRFTSRELSQTRKMLLMKSGQTALW